MSTIAVPSPTLAARFQSLADEWQTATRFLSAPAAAIAHPAYRAIIDLGPDVVPCILADLAVAPEPWFAALRELTGADPVPPKTAAGRAWPPNIGWLGAALTGWSNPCGVSFQLAV